MSNIRINPKGGAEAPAAVAGKLVPGLVEVVPHSTWLNLVITHAKRLGVPHDRLVLISHTPHRKFKLGWWLNKPGESGEPCYRTLEEMPWNPDQMGYAAPRVDAVCERLRADSQQIVVIRRMLRRAQEEMRGRVESFDEANDREKYYRRSGKTHLADFYRAGSKFAGAREQAFLAS